MEPWQEEASDLALAISRATRSLYEPYGSVVLQLRNAFGRVAVNAVAASLDRELLGTGAASGTVAVWAGEVVAVARLSNAPSAHATPREDWSISVQVLARTRIRGVTVRAEPSRNARVQEGRHDHLLDGTSLALRYEGLDDALVFKAGETEDLEALHALVLADLRASR